MKINLLMTIILPVFAHCQQAGTAQDPEGVEQPVTIHKIADIPLPNGYKRIEGTDSLFARWLRTIDIKKDKRVFLYNGNLKRNQDAQYAVLDIPVGKKDLQQCADAVMRLRAEYLRRNNRTRDIWFADNNGTRYQCPSPVTTTEFETYLEKVFTRCGTLSLEKQLKRVMNFTTIQPGDVLIKGGSPGHAVLVVDVAENTEGKRVYLLAQSYMPAQDIHILVNPKEETLSPWYTAEDSNYLIYSPEWTFLSTQLRRW